MSNNDLSGLNLGELKELGKKVADQIMVAEKQEIERAAEQIEAIARSVNLSVQDLIERSGVLAAKGKRGPKPGVKGAAIYQNPKDVSQTWTGRGRQPRWVADHIAGGGQLGDLRRAE
jgi:DNA-binding protein H-NS